MGQPSARLRVLTAGIFSLILTLGVARFAYTLLLPPMQAVLGCRYHCDPAAAADCHAADAGFTCVLRAVAVEVVEDHALDAPLGLEGEVGLGGAAAADVDGAGQ